MALRHLADDVRERFARLRMRHHASCDDSTAKTKRRSKVVTQSSADRTATPDLIRPHVDGRTASLPPLPPTPTGSSAADRPRRRRRSSAYLCPSSSAAVMGHIYEEIPPTTPPPPHRSGSTSSCVDVGRVYYVSPLDGALCRIFPVDERAVHRRQLACEHVRRSTTAIPDDRTPSVDVVGIAAASGLAAVRGRELRLCADCCRRLRESLADDEKTRDFRRRSDDAAATTRTSPSLSPSFYNSCDLSLLNVPCCYSSEAGDLEEVSPTDARRSSDTADILPTVQHVATSGDVINGDAPLPTTPKFGEAESAFTKFDGGRRDVVGEGPLKDSGDSRRDSSYNGRRRRLVTNLSFDDRRRPLRNPDDSFLAVLDSSAPGDADFRGGFRRDVVSGLPVDCSAAKSTSCADVSSAQRRRSLAVRRRSDDDDDRRRGFHPTSGGAAATSRRRSSACCGGSELSLQGRAGVKSVYYNGLLASMIDLTAASDRSSADDRLSCRATSGPRRSLRPSRQSPSLSERCPADRFVAAIRHSSGDLRLRSVQ